MAQLAERSLTKPEVCGSNPLIFYLEHIFTVNRVKEAGIFDDHLLDVFNLHLQDGMKNRILVKVVWPPVILIKIKPKSNLLFALCKF